MPLLVHVPRVSTDETEDPDRTRWLNVLDPRKTAVQRELRRHGLAGYEPPTQATLLALMSTCPEGRAFVDVGAHIGLYSALVAATCQAPSARIVAIEPTPQTAAMARKLARVNGLDIEVAEVALSDSPGEARLYLSDKAETSNSLNESFREHAEDVVVSVSTVDSLVAEKDLRPHVIKIDVETLESAVLDGAMDTIERHRPWIVVEILDASAGSPLNSTLDRIEGMGYTFYPLAPDMEWIPGHPRNGTRAVEGYRDWLLAPTPMDAATASDIGSWRRAIERCTQETNALVPRGTSFAPGWNAKDVWTIT
jgi:FkbM family methyltransferase